MKRTIQRLLALCLCLVTLFSLVPVSSALADEPYEQNVTIQSERNGGMDYLEYYSNSSWHDLNTPKHWVESTGQVCYCVEHSYTNPHGASYTAAEPSTVFKATTLAGLQSILMYGYPCNCPEGFTEDEARQATANAIRFWLSENGEPGSYGFTNRKAHPDRVRAKRGYEHVLEWADELLQMAREKRTISHNITFSPSALTLTRSGDTFVGTTMVQLTNINSGYTLDTSELPSGVSITGYTGTGNDTLTITAASELAGRTMNFSAIGSDTRVLENITAYIPSNSGLQKIFLCANTAQIVANASIGVNTPAAGGLRIVKAGDGGVPLAGARFGVYSDPNCLNLVSEVTTGNDGAVTINGMNAGTYYVKELATVRPYVIDGMIHSVMVRASELSTLELSNQTAKGVIRIYKTGEVLVGTTVTETGYDQLHTPKYEQGGLAGCRFSVKDANNNEIIVTSAEDGIAETGLLPFGTYTVQEIEAPAGYELDSTVHTVTLAYADSNTPIVYSEIEAVNNRLANTVKLKKVTDFFDYSDMQFHSGPLEGAVFGLYTGENIGPIPKDALVDLLTTDANGTAVSSAPLPAGRYYLRELFVPDSTIHLLQESLPLDVNGSNTQRYDTPIENERFKGQIGIWKMADDDPNLMLAGAVYEVRDGEGRLYCTMTTDRVGYALSSELPVGTYYVKEIVPPEGYMLSDEVLEVTLSTADKNTLVFEFTNESNSASLRKKDLTTGKPVPHAVVQLRDSSGNVVFEGETDENGEIILIGLSAGTYTYTETVAAAGYTINTGTFSFAVDFNGNVTGTTEFTDEPICLQIDKIDLFTGEPIGNVEFRLVDADDQTVRTVVAEPISAQSGSSLVISNGNSYRVWQRDGQDTFFVDENGHIEFRYLPAGEYRLIEIAPDGYIAEDEIAFTLTDRNGVSNPKIVTVANKPTGIKIKKIDAASNNPLAGAGFAIKVRGENGFEALKFVRNADGSYRCDSEGTVTELMVDGMGEILLYGVPIGDIWIEETTTPDGYFPISAQRLTVTKEMSSDAPYTMTIKNSKFVKLGMDSDWWEFPMLCGGILLLVAVLIAMAVAFSRKKRKHKRNC